MSNPKSIFDVQEALVMGCIHGPYGRILAPTKKNAIIQNMKEECGNMSRLA